VAADPERLHQLRQQRERIAEHLAWLDREIADASADASGAETPTTESRTGYSLRQTTPPAPIDPRLAVTATEAARTEPATPGLSAPPQAVLEDWQERQDDGGSPEISKTGCWLIFAAIMLVGCGGALWAIFHFWG
jgi:hypothetical protein